MDPMPAAELVDRLGAAVTDRALQRLDDLFDPGFVDHGSRAVGVDSFRARLARLTDGLPDLRYSIERVLDDGEFVATHIVLEGTHDGSLLGVPPTGRAVYITAVDLIRRGRDGRIAERWGGLDTFDLLQQLGALPGAPAPDTARCTRSATTGRFEPEGHP